MTTNIGTIFRVKITGTRALLMSSTAEPLARRHYRPRKATQDLIERVLAVLAEYADHLSLTIRQIFYRLVGARTADDAVGDQERASLRASE
jgi:hypothetical protein